MRDKEANTLASIYTELIDTWYVAEKKEEDEEKLNIPFARRRSTSLTDSIFAMKINQAADMEVVNLEIPIKNRFSSFTEYFKQDSDKQLSYINRKTYTHSNSQQIKPLPIYLYGKIDHINFLDVLRIKYKNNF